MIPLRSLAAAFVALVVSLGAGDAGVVRLSLVQWKPYLGTNAIGFFKSQLTTLGIWFGSPDSVTVGGVNALAYESTQPWTGMAAIRLNPAIGNGTGIIFTNATNSPDYRGYEMIVDQTGKFRVRVINSIATSAIDVTFTRTCG